MNDLISAWVLGSVICKLVPYLQGVSVAASVYTLVAVAVERHRSISFPWKRRLSSSCGRWIILFIWLFAFIITLPWLFVFNQSLSPEGFLVIGNSSISHIRHLILCIFKSNKILKLLINKLMPSQKRWFVIKL